MDQPTSLAKASLVFPDFALHWAKQLGASIDSLTALRGGINNQVFSCEVENHKSKRFVIKGYSLRSSSDRMAAEVQFLRYAALVAPSYVPSLIADDEEHRCVVLEYLDGHPYPVGVSPSEQDVLQASRFFHLLNADKLFAQKYIKQTAAEGFLSLNQHLESVARRLAQFSTGHLSVEMRSDANLLVRKILRQLDVITNQTRTLIEKGLIQDRIVFNDCCVSPSDFGFHNAFRTTSGVKFFDFEFSGWDDPAKLIVDFMLQPRMPVAPNLSKLFYRSVIPLGGEELWERAAALGPILRLKWLCIMLSVLRPDRLREMRAVAQDAICEIYIKQRLEEAQAYIQKEFSYGLY
jgi:hypothetical protein